MSLLLCLTGWAVAQTDAVVEGGTLILRAWKLPTMATGTIAGAPDTTWPVMEPLVKYDGKAYIPLLAEKIDVSEDLRTWSVTLRKNVIWHDGHPFTAQDVVFSYNLLANPEVPDMQMHALDKVVGYDDYQRGEIDHLTGVKILDEYTVQFELSESTSQFMLTLARLHILPSHILKDVPPEDYVGNDFFNHPIGTGPFKFVRRVEGQYAEYERFDAYWRGTPHIEKLILYVYSDKAGYMSDLLKGKVLGGTVYPFELTEADLNLIKSNPDLQLMLEPAVTWRGLVFNLNRMPNRNVRRALVLALDIPALAKIIGEPPTTNPTRSIFAEQIFRNPAVDQAFQYDPELARQILEEEGWDFSREIKLCTYYTGSVWRDLLMAIQSYWSAIGVKCSIVQFEGTPTFIDQWYVKQNYDVLWCGYNQLPGFPSCMSLWFSSSRMYPQGGNISYHDPVADSLLDAMAKQVDPEGKTFYSQLLDLLAYNEYYVVTFYIAGGWQPVSKRLHNYRAVGDVYDKAAHTWWLEPQG